MGCGQMHVLVHMCNVHGVSCVCGQDIHCRLNPVRPDYVRKLSLEVSRLAPSQRFTVA